MPLKKKINKGKRIYLEPISEKPKSTNTHPKTEPWISVTKTSAKKEDIPNTLKFLKSPEVIMNQMLQLQKAFAVFANLTNNSNANAKPTSHFFGHFICPIRPTSSVYLRNCH